MSVLWMFLWILGLVYALGLSRAWVVEIGQPSISVWFHVGRLVWISIVVFVLVVTFGAVWL